MKPDFRKLAILLLAVAMGTLIAACRSGGEPAATPPALGTQTPASSPTPSPDPAGGVPPLTLTVLSPSDGMEIEWGAARVTGVTRPDAVVGINGRATDVSVDGRFSMDVPLDEGINIIDVVAATLFGEDLLASHAVFVLTPPDTLPFSLFHPVDGLQVDRPSITVTGVTRPDAIVGINGVPVDINALGLFSATVQLEDGINVVEIVAVDVDGHERSASPVVFYTP